MNYASLSRKHNIWYDYAVRIRVHWGRPEYLLSKRYELFVSMETWDLPMPIRQGLYSGFQGVDISL